VTTTAATTADLAEVQVATGSRWAGRWRGKRR
jgi:hypothetical protein